MGRRTGDGLSDEPDCAPLKVYVRLPKRSVCSPLSRSQAGLCFESPSVNLVEVCHRVARDQGKLVNPPCRVEDLRALWSSAKGAGQPCEFSVRARPLSYSGLPIPLAATD
jgi:hypothetical protein